MGLGYKNKNIRRLGKYFIQKIKTSTISAKYQKAQF